MKIYFPLKSSPHTGKGLFIQRLACELKKYKDIEFISDPLKSHDITLYISKIFESNSKKKVYRVDGVIHNIDQNYKDENKKIASRLHSCDAVVYQSVFGKDMCDTYLGVFKGPSSIILNGDNIKRFDNAKPFISNYNNNFIAVSRWRPHKRLNDIIQSFILANIESSCLWIVGDITNSILSLSQIKSYKKISNIRFLGNTDPQVLAGIYKACKGVIHLCWFDCCPNVVVEAICAGCIPITNNVGGNPELSIPANGIACNIDSPYNKEVVKLYRPPKINHQLVADAIDKVSNSKIKINTWHVDIKNTARQYANFFREIL